MIYLIHDKVELKKYSICHTLLYMYKKLYMKKVFEVNV